MAQTTRQLLIFAGIALAAAGLAALLVFSGSGGVFRRFFGGIHPLVALIAVGALGLALMAYLVPRGGFAVFDARNARGWLLALGLGTLFAAIIVLVDRAAVFPRDLNVPFPQSVPFYPAIGFVVEVIFHLLPLALLIAALTALFPHADRARIAWVCIGLVALLEPVYQTAGFVGAYPAWVVIYVFAHVLLINVAQLWLFRRCDFAAMLALRLAYYLLWHIVWGHARLGALFSP